METKENKHDGIYVEEVTELTPLNGEPEMQVTAIASIIDNAPEAEPMKRTRKPQEAPIRAREGGKTMKKEVEKEEEVNLEALRTFSEKDYEQQHNYVENLKKMGDVGFSLVATETFVESMRDSGYKSTATAIDEFIDNAIQAAATRVDVLYEIAGKDIASITVVDDGHGMEPDMIRAAVLWGGTHRANDRKGFGRFGFGLPSAAVSISKHYEVYSRTDGNGWHRVVIDLPEIVAGKYRNDQGIVVAPPSTKADIPDMIKKYLGKRELKHGTVIHIVNPDRLTGGFRKQAGFHRNMMEHLGLIYRHTMRSCPIYFNGDKVQPVDPLFLDPTSRYYDIDNGVLAEGRDELRLEVKTPDGERTGKLTVRFSLLPPPKFQRNADGSLNKERWGIMGDTHAYFIVTRAGRQIDLIRNANFPKEDFNKVLLNYDRNWAVELDFEPVLDEDFGITVNKQQVTISDRMWAILQDQGVGAMVKSLWTDAEKMRKKAKTEEQPEEKTKASESTMSEAEKFFGNPVRTAPEKETKAKEKVLEEAKKKAKETGRPEEEHAKEFAQEIHERPYKVMFEHREGAPFYRLTLFGAQRQLFINTAHKFYMNLYAGDGSSPRIKSSLELLLFVLGSCEAEATGDLEIFYQTERAEWSKRLNVALALLDRKEPTEEAEEAVEFSSEVSGAATA